MGRSGGSLMLFTHYLLGYVGTSMCSIGLILSLCSVYVFTRRRMRGVVATYLTGLSISDSLLLLFGLLFAINSSIPPNRQSEFYYSSTIHKYSFPYVYACIIWFQFTSVWVIIAFAIDRWFAIKWPLLHYTYSSKRAWYIVVTIYCLGFIYSIPRFFEYKTEVRSEELTVSENITEYFSHIVITNKLQNSRFYQVTVHLILYSLLQSILPLLLLSYFNVELIRNIHASSHFVKNCTRIHQKNARLPDGTNGLRYKENVVTRSVISLIGLFTICQIPASILHFIYMFYQSHSWLYISYDISNFLILFNSTLNFFIFACFNRKFRRELTTICSHRSNRAQFLQRLSKQVFRGTNSNLQASQRNHLILKTDHSNNSECQKQVNNINFCPSQKQTIESEIPFHAPSCKKHNLSQSINRSNNNQSNNNRFSMCEFHGKRDSIRLHKNSKSSINDLYDKKYSLSREKSSLKYSTNGINCMCNNDVKSCYVKLRYKTNQKKVRTSITSSTTSHSV